MNSLPNLPLRKWKRSYSSDSDSVVFMTPLSTQSFDFHYHKRSYDSDSDFVTSENQPKVLKLLKPELECHGGYIGSPRDQYLGYSYDNSLQQIVSSCICNSCCPMSCHNQCS